MKGASETGVPDTTPTPEITQSVTRGTARMFEDLGCAVLAEMPLANGRRADLVALDAAGLVTIVEVKSGIADYLSDHKWSAYGDFCDQFYFAVTETFPIDRLPPPDLCGLILADAWGAEIVRPSPMARLAAARRKTMTIRFARTAAQRLRAAQDPRV